MTASKRFSWSIVYDRFPPVLRAREADLKQTLTGVIFEQFGVTRASSQDVHRFMSRLIRQFENRSAACCRRRQKSGTQGVR
jgi:hypothetical protein